MLAHHKQFLEYYFYVIIITSILGYEPAGLTQNDREWVNFFRMGV